MGSSRQALHPGLFIMFSLRTESICLTNGGWWKVCTMSKNRYGSERAWMRFLKPQMTLKNCKLNTVGEMELKQDFWPNTLVRLLLQIRPKRKDFKRTEKKRNIVAGMTCLWFLHKLTLILQLVTIHTNYGAETVWFFFYFKIIKSLVFLEAMYLTTCLSLGNPLFCKHIQLFKHWKKRVTSQSLTFPYRLS